MSPIEVHELGDIQIRNPFLLTVTGEGAYYLFGNTGPAAPGAGTLGFDCYRSADLRTWHGPIPAFRPSAYFWAEGGFWAPEVHRYAGRYFLFATFATEGVARGTQILAADHPAGPYEPWSDGPVTPAGWDCSDGTLHIDDAGNPWIVFCNGWAQSGQGAMIALRLSEDLRRPISRPLLLFETSEAYWSPVFHHPRMPAAGRYRLIAGPFLHRLRNGELIMLWSSLGNEGYAMGISRSETGRITGRWLHPLRPVLDRNGGHGMIARSLSRQLLLTWHQPSGSTQARAVIRPIAETSKGIRLLNPEGAA